MPSKQVIGFSAGGGEDNLIASGGDEPGHLAALLFHDRFDCRSKVVHRRGIAETFDKERQHGFQNFGAHRGGRSVIYISSFQGLASGLLLNVKFVAVVAGIFTDAHKFLPVLGAPGRDVFQGAIVIG